MQTSMPLHQLRRNRRFHLTDLPWITGKLLKKGSGSATVVYDGSATHSVIALNTLVVPNASVEGDAQ